MYPTMKTNKKDYNKIRQNIINTWPIWKINLCNQELLISKNSQKIKPKEYKYD